MPDGVISPPSEPSVASPRTAGDDDLVTRLRAGDQSAFAQIVGEWSPVMLHVARRYVGSRAAAEDVVQEAWLGVISGLARFEGRSSLRSWTFSILINRAKTHHVKERRVVASAALTGLDTDHPTVDPGRFQGPDGEYPGHWTSTGAPRPWDEPEGGLLNREIATLIDQALDTLPERQRLAVQLRDVQGLTSAEACAALNVSEQNQRVLLHRGRATLRSALESYHRG